MRPKKNLLLRPSIKRHRAPRNNRHTVLLIKWDNKIGDNVPLKRLLSFLMLHDSSAIPGSFRRFTLLLVVGRWHWAVNKLSRIWIWMITAWCMAKSNPGKAILSNENRTTAQFMSKHDGHNLTKFSFFSPSLSVQEVCFCGTYCIAVQHSRCPQRN